MEFISRLIEDYQKEAANSDRGEHLQYLLEIGTQLDNLVPNDISQSDLIKLEKSLGKLRQVVKSENPKDTKIETINGLIAKVSRLATKKPTQRTEQMNLDLLNLGGQLVNLSQILKIAPISIVAHTFFEHFVKY